jgi:hypothetical protein
MLGNSFSLPPVFAKVLIFFIAGLLSIALKARHSIGSVSHPVETGLLISSLE